VLPIPGGLRGASAPGARSAAAQLGGLKQFPRQVHTSMPRAIQPFHTDNDADVLYAVTTSEVKNPALSSALRGLQNWPGMRCSPASRRCPAAYSRGLRLKER
jgi:hypothetical protein